MYSIKTVSLALWQEQDVSLSGGKMDIQTAEGRVNLNPHSG